MVTLVTIRHPRESLYKSPSELIILFPPLRRLLLSQLLPLSLPPSLTLTLVLPAPIRAVILSTDNYTVLHLIISRISITEILGNYPFPIYTTVPAPACVYN